MSVAWGALVIDTVESIPLTATAVWSSKVPSAGDYIVMGDQDFHVNPGNLATDGSFFWPAKSPLVLSLATEEAISVKRHLLAIDGNLWFSRIRHG
jgi:hypothetical protein